MPRIDFYILNTGDLTTRLEFACRLAEKAYKNRHRLYIHTEHEQDAHQMDELLWTYRDESFLPHNLYGEGPEEAPPIQIGFGIVPEKQRDILMNLSNQVPTFYKNFNRVLELVANDSNHQAKAREHFKMYRAAGYEISTHKLQTIE